MDYYVPSLCYISSAPLLANVINIVYVCMYVCMYACIYLSIYLSMYVSIYIYICVCVCVCMYVCMYVSLIRWERGISNSIHVTYWVDKCRRRWHCGGLFACICTLWGWFIFFGLFTCKLSSSFICSHAHMYGYMYVAIDIDDNHTLIHAYALMHILIHTLIHVLIHILIHV